MEFWRVIRSDATRLHDGRSHQPLPRIRLWRDWLEAVLSENESRAAQERLTLIRIFKELGCARLCLQLRCGSTLYDRVA
jgi:hypothetical protein